MSLVVLDTMNDATAWSAVAADGSASTALTIADAPQRGPTGTDPRCVLLTASAAATGHLLRRDLPARDVSDCSELRFSVRANRSAGPPGRGFFLELRLGSAALAPDDPANTWHRFVPVRAAATWETVVCGIEDLPSVIAKNLSRIQFRCVEAPFTARLDGIVAVRPQLLADADAALAAVLAGVALGATPVAARVRTAAEAVPPAPALDILHSGVRHARQRVDSTRVARDFRADQLRLVAAGDPYDLDYEVRAVAGSRAEEALLLEAVLDRLGGRGELMFAGVPMPVELRCEAPDSAAVAGEPVLRYRVGTRARARIALLDWQVRDLVLDADHLEVS
ncbi:hypothetical protein AB0H76_17885 [Nocardia sp. NPDC050712]|uniref:hypothetical protein n=1 Tax=Nocardia sp. NPDC050712 TaxID=3155518 RepID=UPI0033FB295E